MNTGDRLGPYEVLGKLGEGGMGQVLRARDTKLDRQVAIKLLPAAFAHDADRLARFQREARTLASLNHPHIAAIYGLEESPSTGSGQAPVTALVMELVEGEDLAQRLTRLRATGASARQAGMPLDEALPIARQIADALEAAHEQGIIHRDLKPANIKIRPDGTVKVLDFGLAKAIEGAGEAGRAGMAGGAASMSPTLTTPAMTQAGMILGTAAYMSPEQARGKPLDRRTDIWAFGCVLYEMLTGTRAFQAEDISLTLAEVMKSEPDWRKLPTLPPLVETFLRQCFNKDPRHRLQDIGDMRLALEGAFIINTSAPTTTHAASPPSWGARAVAIVATVAAAALGWPAVRHLREVPQPPPPEMRLDIATPPTADPGGFALSPDGRSILYVAADAGRSKLWLRALNQTTAKAIPGTEDASWPFWSPDGRTIGFFANAKLLRLDLPDGRPRALADSPVGSGAAWSGNGVIVFAPSLVGPLSRIRADGGAAEIATHLAPGETAHSAPAWLPDNTHFLYSVFGNAATSGIFIGSIDGGDPVKLSTSNNAASGGEAMWLSADHILYKKEQRLLVQRVDPERKTLVGEPATVAETLGTAGGANSGTGFSAANGVIAFRSDAIRRRVLNWRDRSGQVVGQAGKSGIETLNYFALSRDGRALAGGRTTQAADLYVLDLIRNNETRFTFDPNIEAIPIWSPDGRRLAFESNRAGVFSIYVGAVDQPGAEQGLIVEKYPTVVQDWSSDGRFLLFYANQEKTARDLWALDLASTDHRRIPIAVTPAVESLAKFSPDGRWVAYQTNASGRFEIVVQPFGERRSPGRWQISTDGGTQPMWRPDGKELYFIAPDGALYAAAAAPGQDTFSFSPPVRLFATRINGGGGLGSNAVEYAVAPDGRFLIDEVVDADVAPITVILNPKY